MARSTASAWRREIAESMGELTVEQGLRIISLAWGRQRGYAFFPTIRGDAKSKAERIQSYREGKAYRWPADREEILLHLKANVDNEVYWCPNLFEYPRRRSDFAMDEMCLWADLDEVDPRNLEDYPPTIAWETSPGRYQALWLSRGPTFLGSSWPGRENQRMTAYIDADPSGWDSTQLLRIPGWVNHKPENLKKHGEWLGGLVWSDWRDRPRYDLEDFEGLPETGHVEQWEGVLEDVVDKIDPRDLWTKTRLKLPVQTRQLFKAKSTAGADRSETMWRIERDLADAGLGVPEIVALMRTTPWNKYEGRQDEFRRLTVEANKAVAMRVETKREDKRDSLEVEEIRHELQSLTILFSNLKPAAWIVKDIWTEGACGFIAGQPKLHKSWLAFDLALSVATGTDFLGCWKVVTPGPVMYLQEEDPAPELKRRFSIMWPHKRADRVVRESDGSLWWQPPQDMSEPDVSAMIGNGFVLSDPTWQEWLDEQLTAGRGGVPWRMVVFDPFLMMLGDVDDNKAPVMTEQIFKPVKQLAQKHGVAMCIVHHMRKGQAEGRGGQMMLGSVANHAFSQDALYLSYGKRGLIEVERESKSAAYLKFKIGGVTGLDAADRWEPQVTGIRGLWDDDDSGDDVVDVEERPRRRRRGQDMFQVTIEAALKEAGNGGMTTNELCQISDLSRTATLRRLKAMNLERRLGRWYAR